MRKEYLRLDKNTYNRDDNFYLHMLQDLSPTLQSALWEYQEKNLRYDSHIVIIRALCFGEKKDIDTLIQHIGKEKIIHILQQRA